MVDLALYKTTLHYITFDCLAFTGRNLRSGLFAEQHYMIVKIAITKWIPITYLSLLLLAKYVMICRSYHIIMYESVCQLRQRMLQGNSTGDWKVLPDFLNSYQYLQRDVVPWLYQELIWIWNIKTYRVEEFHTIV